MCTLPAFACLTQHEEIIGAVRIEDVLQRASAASAAQHGNCMRVALSSEGSWIVTPSTLHTAAAENPGGMIDAFPARA